MTYFGATQEAHRCVEKIRVAAKQAVPFHTEVLQMKTKPGSTPGFSEADVPRGTSFRSQQSKKKREVAALDGYSIIQTEQSSARSSGNLHCLATNLPDQEL